MLIDKVNSILRRYDNSRRNDKYEPEWNLGYDRGTGKYMIASELGIDVLRNFQEKGVNYLRTVYQANDWYENDEQMLEDFEKNLPYNGPDGFVKVEDDDDDDDEDEDEDEDEYDYNEDGCPVGWYDWVFMGRKDSLHLEVPFKGGKAIIIRRDIPDAVLERIVRHPELDDYVYIAYGLTKELNDSIDSLTYLTMNEVLDHLKRREESKPYFDGHWPKLRIYLPRINKS